ncbi:TPA: fimbrial protein [Photobacterium damselae]
MRYLLCFFSFFVILSTNNVFAKVATAIVTVEGSVAMPTCSVNGNTSIADGITQTVQMGLYSAQDLVSNMVDDVDVPLVVSCTDASNLAQVYLSFSTIGAYPPVGAASNGTISTTLSGVSILLKDKTDLALDLSTGSRMAVVNDGNGVFDGTIKARLQVSPGFDASSIEKGKLMSGVSVTFSYL